MQESKLSTTKNIARSSAMITIILIISKIMGALRELLIATQFGANRESDIFKTATRMPQLFYACVAAAITTTFIPIFSDIKRDKEKANLFFNNIFNIILVLCIIMSGIGIIFAPQLTKLFATGFNYQDFLRTSQMTKIVMPTVIFFTLSGLLTGYLQSYGIFLQPALTGITADIIIIVAVVIFAKYGIIAAIIAFLLSSIGQILIQRPFMKEYKYKFYINFNDPNIRRMIKIAIPTLISTSVAQINVIVNTRYASRLVAGSISVVDYASKISSIVSQVFIISLTTVLYPMITEKFASKDRKAFEDIVIKSINIIIMISIPLVFGMYVLSPALVKLLLEHGNFDSNASTITSLCLRYLAFSALGYSLIDILSKIFYSTKDTFTPMINGFILVAINYVMILLFVPRIGVNGLALSTTTSTLLIAVIMFLEIKLKLKDISFKKSLVAFVKCFISGVAMMIVISILYSLINKAVAINSNLYLMLELALITAIGAVIYIGMLYLLKVEEFKIFLSLRFRKKN